MRIEDEIKTSGFKDNHVKALVNINFTASWIGNIHNQLLKPFGISMQQYNILRILRGSRPEHLPVSEVKLRMVDKTPNTTRLVDKLLAKGLAERFRCDKDRRVVYLGITDAGLEAMTEIDKVFMASELSDLPLTDDEARILSDLLDKLRG
ncbi:MarR family transcriptional regulator [Fulvitalea axinellae]|uniref:MarR family transcriptional regulator n=1 Tax=Fulvitalea axinellae TaxID=1182444 RepID=A0AAU9CR50_9BACT|nr:MarR family transcriptional regulator [Fulvitalea axinellae]